MMTWILALLLAVDPAPRPSVAIAPPVPVSGPDTWVGMAIADNLGTRLQVHSRLDPKSMTRLYPLNVFSWRQVHAAARAEGVETGRPVKTRQLDKLQRALGSDYVFSGTYLIKNDAITLTWKLHGSKKKPVRRTMKLTDLAAGVETLTVEVLAALGQDNRSLGGHKLASVPLAAMKPYGEALEILGRQSMDPRAHLVLPEADVKRAHVLLSAATDASPEFVRAWVERGVASAMLGEMSRAEEEMVQALAHAGEFEPSNSLGLYYLYDRQGKTADALKVLEEATSTHLGFLHGLGYLGNAYLRATESHKALSVFTNYNVRVPRSPWAKLMRATALARIGKHDLALEETQALLDTNPKSITLLTAMASRQIDAEKHRDARKTLERALKMYPKHPALLTRLSYIELETGDPERALALAEEAVKKLGDGRGETLAGYAHLNYGHALAIANRNSEAYAALREAIRLGIESQDRMMLVRDKRLKKFLAHPHSPIKPDPDQAN